MHIRIYLGLASRRCLHLSKSVRAWIYAYILPCLHLDECCLHLIIARTSSGDVCKFEAPSKEQERRSLNDALLRHRRQRVALDDGRRPRRRAAAAPPAKGSPRRHAACRRTYSISSCSIDLVVYFEPQLPLWLCASTVAPKLPMAAAARFAMVLSEPWLSSRAWSTPAAAVWISAYRVLLMI